MVLSTDWKKQLLLLESHTSLYVICASPLREMQWSVLGRHNSDDFLLSVKAPTPPVAISHVQAARACSTLLQVEHAAGQGQERGMSFRNTWLRHLGVRLPTLALAVDDALIGFAERLASILGSPTPAAQTQSGGGPHDVQVMLRLALL